MHIYALFLQNVICAHQCLHTNAFLRVYSIFLHLINIKTYRLVLNAYPPLNPSSLSLSLSIYIYIYIYISVCLSISHSISISLNIYVYIYIYIYIYIYMSLWLCLSVSASLSLPLPPCLCLYLSLSRYSVITRVCLVTWIDLPLHSLLHNKQTKTTFTLLTIQNKKIWRKVTLRNNRWLNGVWVLS